MKYVIPFYDGYTVVQPKEGEFYRRCHRKPFVNLDPPVWSVNIDDKSAVMRGFGIHGLFKEYHLWALMEDDQLLFTAVSPASVNPFPFPFHRNPMPYQISHLPSTAKQRAISSPV